MRSKLFIFLSSIFTFLFVLPLVTSTIYAANKGDVVINEIMWMGTRASSFDEWIELFNTTSTDIDLGGWSLYAQDGTPEIMLFGTIDSKSFFLLERTDENTVMDIMADQIYTGALENDGEELVLRDQNDKLIDLVEASSGWFAGDAGGKASMERIDPGVSGDEVSNWCTNNKVIVKGRDADGNELFGTPKSQNSCHLITPTLIPLPTIVSTPTPTPEMAISYSIPSQVAIGEAFEVPVAVSGANTSSQYYLKALIGVSLASSDLREGRTLGADGKSWLAWNAAWSKMPTLLTNSSGGGTTTISAKSDDDVSPGEFYFLLRIREVGTDKNIDSSAKQFLIIPAIIPTSGPSPPPTPTPITETESSVKAYTGTIVELKTLPIGTQVLLEAYATVPPGVFGEKVIYVADATGGIMVKFTKEVEAKIKLGDKVKINSTVEESREEKYIKTEVVEILETGLDPVPALKILTGEVDEEYEGRLVEVFGRIVETSGSTFWLDDGSGRAKVYVKVSTNIELPRKNVGDYARVVGVVSQWGSYDDGTPNFRVLPRYEEDIVFSSQFWERGVLEEGEVLGDKMVTLPRTGRVVTEMLFYYLFIIFCVLFLFFSTFYTFNVLGPGNNKRVY